MSGLHSSPAAGLLLALVSTAHARVPGSVHTVFSTECSPYFDWQSIGVAHTHKLVGQSGPITRLSACPLERRDLKRDSQIMRTHYHESWERHPTNNDTYSAYNMPVSVIDWMKHATIREEYVMYIDGDMLFRRPVDPRQLGVRRGVAVGARYDYLFGLSNAIISNFGVPNAELAPHVGGIYILHVDDFRTLAPRWLYWTERFRTETHRYWADPHNPQASEEDLATGDVYVAQGRAPWISAMYGYSFAAAELGIKHLLPDDLMLYAGARPLPSPWARGNSESASLTRTPALCPMRAPAGSHWIPLDNPVPPLPMIIHYGLPLTEQGHAFDKQWLRKLDVLHRPCPPRYLLTPALSAAAVLGNHSLSLREKVGALVTIETLCSLNQALGDFYVRTCGSELSKGSSESLLELLPPACPLREATAGLAALEVCRDAASDCSQHGASSCALDPERLRARCRRTCRACSWHDHPDGAAREAALKQVERWDSLARPRARLASSDANAAECELVAARGECGNQGNSERCALSCNGARDASGERHDDSVHCSAWAKLGQCWHNPRLMEIHCPQACTFDANPPVTADGAQTCGVDEVGCAEAPACADEAPACRSWALQGECEANAAFMVKSCCRSCAEWKAHQAR